MTYGPWDQGVRWRTEFVSLDDDAFLALDVKFVTDRVLRAFTGDVESLLIERLIRTATWLCEHETGDSVRPQTLKLYLDRFPPGHIELQGAPVRSVASVSYYDSDNAAQDFGGSPPTWILMAAGRYSKATLQPAVGETWPSTACRPDAVTVEYLTGYATPQEVPDQLATGIALCVGELYKNPDLSNDMSQIKNVLDLGRFWPKRDWIR